MFSLFFSFLVDKINIHTYIHIHILTFDQKDYYYYYLILSIEKRLLLFIYDWLNEGFNLSLFRALYDIRSLPKSINPI